VKLLLLFAAAVCNIAMETTRMAAVCTVIPHSCSQTPTAKHPQKPITP